MLKRLSGRAENAMQRIFRSSTSKLPKVKLRYTDWEGLKALVALLDQNPGPFEPLAPVIGQLLTYIEKYEDQARTCPEYAELGADLDELCFHMAKHVDPGLPSSISSESIANFARGLAREVRSLPDEEQGGVEGKQATKTMDFTPRLKGYRRIRRVLALFVMSENTDLWEISIHEKETSKLAMLPHAPEAHYRYAGPGAVPRNGCMLNTRVAVLHELQYWVYYGKSRNVLWLNGTAGTGKTTIAYSLCEYLEGSGRLSASFFCSRIHPSCRDVGRIVPSIVHQLAGQSRPFRRALLHALSQDPEVLKRPINEQFEKIMYVPLRGVAHTFDVDPVVVIDALDQCEDLEAVNQVLDTILTHASDLPVRFLIVSYPTLGIRGRMRGLKGAPAQPELCLHQQAKSVVQEDIKTYLTAHLQHLALSAPDLEHLSQHSGVLFLYAVAIVDYSNLGEASKHRTQLKDLLEHPSLSDGSQNQEAAYAAMLERALRVEMSDPAGDDEIRLVLGALASTGEQTSVNTIAGLLGLDFARLMRGAFCWLLPALHVSSTDDRSVCFDERFTGYLRSSFRSGGNSQGTSRNHSRLAHACFDIIKSVNPPFNICSLESSYLLDKEVAYFTERVDGIILPELLYACRSWGTHVSLSGQDDNLISDLEDFFSARLLLWMEVLSLKQWLEQGAETLSKTRSWVQVGIDLEIDRRYNNDWFQGGRCSTTLQALVKDAHEFVHAFFSSIASNSTPHIYISQLQLWPQDRIIYELYGHRLKKFTNTSHDGHTNVVRSVAYSSDGAYIASGSDDKTIRIWDARTGESVGQPLTGHTYAVYSVAYSPDGAYIASGSDDMTIRIWDARTGESVGQPLTGHTGYVRSVAYSPDGAYIVSGSRDMTIRIWDAHTGKPVGQPLTGHTDQVHSVAYSPDGAYIASGSADKTIRIWDARIGKPAGQPLIGHTYWVRSVAYSPNGSYIASGSSDKTIRIWEARTGKLVGRPLTGHARLVYSVAYSPDGAYIASSCSDETIRIWEARTGKPVGQPLTGYTDVVWSVAYSPNGAYIVSGSSDHSVRIWFAPTRPASPRSVQSSTPSQRTAIKPFRSPFWTVSKSADWTSRGSQPHRSHKANRMPKQQASVIPPITASPHDWTLNEDGWVVGLSRERLIWVPPDLRDRVAPPNVKAILSTEPSIAFDFREATLGLDWHDCYNPS
ncbi:hypothetical protein FRC12_025099 [Ceratobasidium sp. 428]|nr:hypothetical protein FRC12_025099 [Ceratobasidium sp. 428]